MSSFEDFENTQKEMYEEIIEILKEDSDLGQYTDQILDPISYQAEYIRHQQQKIDELEDENELLYRERNGCKADLVKTKLINIKKEKQNQVLMEAVEYPIIEANRNKSLRVFHPRRDSIVDYSNKVIKKSNEALAEVKRIMEGE